MERTRIWKLDGSVVDANYKACAFIARCQNVELMPRTLEDDVQEGNRIKPPLLITCSKRDRDTSHFTLVIRTNNGIDPCCTARADIWMTRCLASKLSLGQVLALQRRTNFRFITLLCCCFAIHQWRPGEAPKRQPALVGESRGRGMDGR